MKALPFWATTFGALLLVNNVGCNKWNHINSDKDTEVEDLESEQTSETDLFISGKNERKEFRGAQAKKGNDHLTSKNVNQFKPTRSYYYRGEQESLNGERFSKEDFMDNSIDDGSLWATNGQTNYYFTRNSIRSAGEVIDIEIEQDLFLEIGAEVKAHLSPSEREKELLFTQERLRKEFFAKLEQAESKTANVGDQIATSSSSVQRNSASPKGKEPTPTATPKPSPSLSPSPSPSPVSHETPEQAAAREAARLAELEKQVPKASLNEVDIFSDIELKAGDHMRGEIIERYPNGNYKVQGTKRVGFKYGRQRWVMVTGIVRAKDIGNDSDVIKSGRLYDYRVQISH